MEGPGMYVSSQGLVPLWVDPVRGGMIGWHSRVGQPFVLGEMASLGWDDDPRVMDIDSLPKRGFLMREGEP